MSDAIEVPEDLKPMSPADMKKAAKSRKRIDFFRLDGGVNLIRLLGPGLPIESNIYKIDGKWTNSLSGSFVIGNDTFRTKALDAGKITENDVEAFTVFGDPFEMLATRYSTLGLDVPRGLWPQRKVVWPIVDRHSAEQKVLRFESSKTFAETINKLVSPEGDYPDLFDFEHGFDIKIVGNGRSGSARRYEAPQVARTPSSVGFDVDVPDFLPMVINGAKGFVARCVDLFGAYGEAAAAVKVEPKSFGLKASQIEVT